MPKKTFLSFRGEDGLKVWSLRNLGEFSNVDFEMDDVSLRKEIDSKDEAYVKSVIRPKIKSCQVCVCLIGENTHRSRKWVPWEITLAAEEGKRLIAMRFKDSAAATTPKVLLDYDVKPFDWDLGRLQRELG
jgi:hypothetical protein